MRRPYGLSRPMRVEEGRARGRLALRRGERLHSQVRWGREAGRYRRSAGGRRYPHLGEVVQGRRRDRPECRFQRDDRQLRVLEDHAGRLHRRVRPLRLRRAGGWETMRDVQLARARPRPDADRRRCEGRRLRGGAVGRRERGPALPLLGLRGGDGSDGPWCPLCGDKQQTQARTGRHPSRFVPLGCRFP